MNKKEIYFIRLCKDEIPVSNRNIDNAVYDIRSAKKLVNKKNRLLSEEDKKCYGVQYKIF